MSNTYISSYANGAAVDAALDLAGTAIQADDLGTAAYEDVGTFATAEQGGKADSAVQPDDLGTAAAEDVAAFATAEQGGKADTAIQAADLGTAAYEDVEAFATAAQGGKADTAIQPNTATQLGSASHYVNIAADGTLTLVGNATVWDDITPGIAAAKTSGPGVSLNLVEMTLDFVATADLNDYAVLPFQLLHRVKAGSSVYPHIHWEQTENHIPNWLIEYRWQRNGSSKTTAWSQLVCQTPAFTYTSGTLNQLSYAAAINAPVGYGISDILQMRVLRDTANTSTLFAGADPYTATASVSSFDPHVEIDSLGSKSEYVK